jgi:hypothetical protein
MHPNQRIHLFSTGGVGTGKTFTLLLLIHGFLKHYNKKLGSNPLKQKAILMAYTGKMTFNIDGTIVHSRPSLPLNCKHLQSLSTKRLDSLSKTYDELQLLVLDEVSLIGSRIFCFIDLHLRSIKHTHNHLFENMDVIITGDLYQAPHVQNNWVFHRKFDNIDALAISFWLDRIHCFEFTQDMRQIDDQSIEVLNKF